MRRQEIGLNKRIYRASPTSHSRPHISKLRLFQSLLNSKSPGLIEELFIQQLARIMDHSQVKLKNFRES